MRGGLAIELRHGIEDTDLHDTPDNPTVVSLSVKRASAYDTGTSSDE
jgi:hypothetical protein